MKTHNMARMALMILVMGTMLGCEPVETMNGGGGGGQGLTPARTPIPTLVPLNISGLEQTDTPLSSAPAIRESDFVLTLESGRFDLLHMGAVDLERMTGKRFAFTDTQMGARGVLETDEAVFEIWSGKADTYIHAVTGKTLRTARGIAVGSAWQSVLSAYPEPFTVSQEGKAYLFAVPIPEEIEDKEFAQSRPLCFYGVRVVMDAAEEYVEEVKIVNRLME